MSNGLEIIIIGTICVTQVILAVVSLWRGRKLATRFARPLSSRTTIAELLEKYSRIHSSLSVRVNADIKHPARLVGDILLINRSFAYHGNLYTTIYACYQLAILHLKSKWLVMISNLLLALYVVQLALIGWSLLKSDNLLSLLLLVSVAVFLLSWVIYFYLAHVSATALEIAVDLLELDKIETKLASSLVGVFQTDVFKYAVFPFVWVVRFVLPF